MYKDKIKETIEQIFKHTSCAISRCEFSDEGGMTWCMIETPDSGFIIGRDGETLRSLNHLVQKIIEKGLKEEEKGPNIFIDVNGYQKKRFENLKNIAHMMAERARYFKSNIEVDPMPAYERRIIHMFLEGAKDIKTESEGYGPNRRVVIKYVDNSI
ncbi:MAG: R3H domain-containing nucleic acid-binding protein [Candidatus Paceibacterota bacterium]|jgi:spoIIIJ-associated protein